jgi:hypothetical protein
MPFSGTYLHQMNFLVLGELNHPSLDMKTVLQETRGNSEVCVYPKKWGQNNVSLKPMLASINTMGLLPFLLTAISTAIPSLKVA